MTYIVKGFKATRYGSLAKAELVTSSEDEANALLASLQLQGFKTTVHFLSKETPDEVRQKIIYNEARLLGEEFFKGTILNLRA